jgi:hypothetical protein
MKKESAERKNPESLSSREALLCMDALRSAIDQGIASGIAKPGVFSRTRTKYGLPQRKD